MNLIGICGKAQSGKDTFCDYSKQMLPDLKIQKIAFAHSLKSFVLDTFAGVQPRNVWGSNEDKNYPLGSWGRLFTDEACAVYKRDEYDLLTARHLLQVIGTDVMRQGKLRYFKHEYIKDKCLAFVEKLGRSKPYDAIWIDATMRDVDRFLSEDVNLCIITDARFENELKAIQKKKGSIVRLYRNKNKPTDLEHPSETEMDAIPDEIFDAVLYEYENNSLKDLEAFTRKTLKEFGFIQDVGGLLV